MIPGLHAGRRFLNLLFLCAFILSGSAAAFGAANEVVKGKVRIVDLDGMVEIIRAGSSVGVFTDKIDQPPLQPGDRLRTGTNTVVSLAVADKSVVRFGALTLVEVVEVDAPNGGFVANLIKGLGYFFHRGPAGRARILTRGAPAGIDGTEVVVEVTEINGKEETRIAVIDGLVRFGEGADALVLTNGQAAIGRVGEAPQGAPGFIVNNLLQWAFYYPAVVDTHELGLTDAERQALSDSLAAYRAGDLRAALAKYPAGREAASDAERIYYAALLLSVGQVQQTETTLASLSSGGGKNGRLVGALNQLIVTVKHEDLRIVSEPQLASELLAASYYQQSRALGDESLKKSLELARKATAVSPEFGFAWARVAELEFSFGHIGRATEALEKSLALSPRNAEALSLRGFLYAAENKTAKALDQFEQALAIDSSLGNAWLGRGLLRIRRGDRAEGREDLLVAAALEPQRAILRSYLGKAFADGSERKSAQKELDLAKGLDKQDPTASLYSALLSEQENRINEGIAEIETAQDLNDNRRLYRSSLMLDQDRAVRSANLARLYREAGMEEVAVREASHAVNADYGNFSAHLFLGSAYNQLRDPNLTSLRYETPMKSEFLIANLLAPAGVGTLSPTVSYQEYSKLFERDRVGLLTDTEYLSRGAWSQSASQYGNYQNFSYSMDVFYRHDPGQRPNNDIEQQYYSLTAREHITQSDSVYVSAQILELETGDVAQYYDPASANAGVRVKEKQEPMLSAGYHHEWTPQNHTLVLVSRMDDVLTFQNPMQPALLISRPFGFFSSAEGLTFNQSFRNHLEIYSGEIQQIVQLNKHTLIAGALIQGGDFETEFTQDQPSTQAGQFAVPAAQASIRSRFHRTSFYAYEHWQILESLQLVGGVSYDRITSPENFRIAPLLPGSETESEVSPKAGFLYQATENSAVRFAYTRSLAGASLDQSFRLEPSHVAGFLQSFRSLIPESIVGANSGAQFETFGLTFEQKLPTRTYIGLTGEMLKSELDRTAGAFLSDFIEFDNAVPYKVQERMEFEERTLLLTINQLIGRMWSFGARYRLSDAEFANRHPSLPGDIPTQNFEIARNLQSRLHQVDLHAIINHPCGFFAGGEAHFYSQDSAGYASPLPGDNFWQLNAYVGYRLPNRRAEAMLGILNLTDQDYRLNPLNLYNELPRTRTLVGRLQLNF